MKRSFPAPPPAPPDAAALEAVERLAGELAAVATPLRLKPTAGETLGCAAYREAKAIEARGYTPRSRALQSVATANAAIQRAREAAQGARGAETIRYRIGRAREELAAARRAIETVMLPVAAE